MSTASSPQGPELQSRRLLLRRLLNWSGGLLVLLLGYPLFRYSRFRVKAKPRYVTVAAPLPLSGYHSEQDFILFAGQKGEGALAVSRTCTHLGCKIQYLEDKKYIECPCHQSRFSTRGKRLTGPAQRDLPTYGVETKTAPDGSISAYVVELR
ncbi:QcrA and Rieske domain-containing protein [Desulfogranum mediterraneum]|uniref:QcrA and Rieske domain-containing protein n=1 Tax=Desulfogranum mediterraneum TaxID=160661 RepID=UPI0003FBB630|nr:Rieske 2Fe-2S domain-containing protein [Desulfogranum mediterraneum]